MALGGGASEVDFQLGNRDLGGILQYSERFLFGQEH